MESVNDLRPIKCENCPKVLMFADIKEGIISKDCPKCKHRNVIVIVSGVIQKPIKKVG